MARPKCATDLIVRPLLAKSTGATALPHTTPRASLTMSGKKETVLDLGKFIDKGVRVKLAGGREGTFQTPRPSLDRE